MTAASRDRLTQATSLMATLAMNAGDGRKLLK